MLTLEPSVHCSTKANATRVLLVEDDDGDVHVFQRLLAKMPEGAVVTRSASIAEAMTKLSETAAFDILLLDLGLPDSEGLDGLRKVLESGVPVVVLTGSDDLELASDAMGLGAQDYLPKYDVTLQKLHRAMVHAIQRHGLRQQLLQVHQREQEMKDSILSHVSHELRTPLTAVAAFVDILREGTHGDLNEKQKEFLCVVERNVRQLKRLIGDLMDMARISAGKLTLETGLVDAKACIADVVDAATSSATEKGILLDVDAGRDVPLVIGDASRVTQVLQNLADNAVKFTKQGGRITFRVTSAQPGMLTVSVEDTGTGIPPTVLPRIFERLEQDDNSTIGSRRGLGLGLWIAREITQSMGGAIRADSEVGVGSRFHVDLPIYSLEGLARKAIGDAGTNAMTIVRVHLEVPGRRSPGCRLQSARQEAMRSLQSCLVTSTDTLVPEVFCAESAIDVFALVRTDARGAQSVKSRLVSQFGDPMARLTRSGYCADVSTDTVEKVTDTGDFVSQLTRRLRDQLEPLRTIPRPK